MTNNHGKISVKGIIIIFTLFLVSISFIILGVYFSYRNNSKTIIQDTLNSLSNTVDNLKNSRDSIDLDNNYSLESTISTNVKLDENNEDIKDYKDFLINLSKINTNIKIVQNKEESKMFYSINSKKNDEDYINIKYLIKDSTGYYYNSYVTNKYINLGNNNYYEALQNNATNKSNYEYIKEHIIESLSNNLSENYSNFTQEKVNYNNTNLGATKVEIDLDNRKANELYKSVINDLKRDEKALYILDNYFEGFKDKRVKNKDFLDKNETLKINIYTTGITNRFIKLEVIKKNNKEEKIISYEKINNSKSYLSTTTNNKTNYKYEIKKLNDNNYNINVFNSKEKNIGTITINKTKKENIVEVSINDNGKRLKIDYRYNINVVKKDKCSEFIKFDIKYLVKNNNVLTLSTEINNKYTDKTEIKEDTTESILEKKLTEEERQKKDEYIDKKLKDLLGGLYEEKEKKN